jgi:CelD/BcsL family acetyltransferase involved in cellulose biosynthesis
MMFGWKTAYDESYAKYSPGALLMLDLSEAMLADTRITAMDSCAVSNHPMIDHLWRERRAIADRLIGVRAERRATFAIARALETARRAGIASAKMLRDRLLHRHRT